MALASLHLQFLAFYGSDMLKYGQVGYIDVGDGRWRPKWIGDMFEMLVTASNIYKIYNLNSVIEFLSPMIVTNINKASQVNNDSYFEFFWFNRYNLLKWNETWMMG